MARPKGSTKKPNENQVAKSLALLGATDEEIANAFSVSRATIYNWKKQKTGFFDAIKKGKIQADARVAQALYHRAIGYEHPEDKIFNNDGAPLIVTTTKHYPPDTAAAFIWLKNRQPDKWRDRPESGGTESADDLLKRIAAALPE